MTRQQMQALLAGVLKLSRAERAYRSLILPYGVAP